MAITTSDQLVAAIGRAAKEQIFKSNSNTKGAGYYGSTLWASGRPGAIVTPSPGVNGAAVDGTVTAGFIPFVNAAGGNQKYLGALELFATNPGYIVLMDTLWWNSGLSVTTTTEQTLTAAASPARDNDGSSNGNGVEAGILVTTATTNSSAVTTITYKYTNSDGTAGLVGALPSFPATATAGMLTPLPMNTGDKGVRSIQSITLGTTLSGGAISLVLFRRIAGIPILLSNTGGSRNFFEVGSRLYSGSALSLTVLSSSTTTGNVFGTVSLIEG